jgi:hypothetical protein
MGTSLARRYDPVMRRYLSRLAERGISMQKIETAQRNRAERLSIPRVFRLVPRSFGQHWTETGQRWLINAASMEE